MGETPADTIAAVIARMEALEAVGAGDARRFFHATYLRTTRAIGRAAEARRFVDRAWVERWDARFAHLYLDALESSATGAAVPEPWTVAFGAARETDLPPLRHVLLGMNAHINFDLFRTSGSSPQIARRGRLRWRRRRRWRATRHEVSVPS